MNGLLDNALADRGNANCNLPRIPTGRYPAYSTTLGGTFDAAGVGRVSFDAERDTLFTELDVDSSSPLTALFVNMTYCNTRYMIHSSARAWKKCCPRKPIFLVGVRDNKRLEFVITGGTPDDEFAITLSGFQGNGCCG